MYIGRLQLKGFKSFGGSHDLILSSGFTAIVGPNGSGKSNLLDALRWSLGDSHPGRLRITRQSDLLFQGSVSMSAAKESEVILQLRDAERSCTIKRRVTAPDGATVLYVNNDRKSLIELNEIKRDWKLEGDRFAFIGQGEVAEVIRQGPVARRQHFETLFGVDVYRKRRMEASDRLAIVKEEHEKLRNLMAELNVRREEIAPEVKKAAKLREILDNIEEKRKLLYWLRRASSEKSIEDIEADIARSYEEHKNLIFFTKAWAKALTESEEALAESLRSKEQQSWELEQCKKRYDGLAKSGFASGTNLRNAKARMAQAEEERERAKEHLNKLSEEQNTSSVKKKDAEEELKKAEKELETTEQKWRLYNERLEEEKEEREAWNKEKGELEASLQQIKAKLSFLGKEVLETREKKDNFLDPRNDIDKEIKELTDKRDALLKEQEEVVKRHNELYASLQTLATDLQRARRTAGQARSKLNQATDSIYSEVYPRPVHYLLSMTQLSDKLKAAPRAVIDVFTCEANLSTALEAYLGGRQFQLLVEDLEEAGRCIDELKTKSVGRATFLPLERCKPRFPDKNFKLPTKGIVGWAIDLITVEHHWLPAIQQILGDLLIVDAYKTGQALVRSGFRGPVVTMEGDVFQPGGTVSGGRSQQTGKTLELKAQIEIFKKEAEDAERESKKIEKQFKETEQEELRLSEKKEEYIRDIRQFDGNIAVLEDKKESYLKESKRMEGEKERIFLAIKEEGVNWQETLKSLSELEEKWNRPSEIEDDQKLIEERERLRAQVTVASERLRSQFALMERVSNEVRAENQIINKLDEEIAELDQTCVKERGSLAIIGKSCLEIFHRRNALIAEIDKYIAGYSGLEKRREYLRKRLSFSEVRARTGMESTTRFESKKGEIERELIELKETWELQYPYPGSEGLPDDVNVDELRRTINSEDRKIKAFGEVNMGVLSEDTSLKDRLAFLGEQLDDVRASGTELEKMIHDADRQAHKVFSDALYDVDKKFCSLFQRLFGGGEAHLEMEEEESIWEAGVDVVARPPGKHPQEIKQLSGGEQSLAAISLLFASMEVAGCPIAVLDEVDAALDEVNLRRFSELTKEYAKNTQILAMTHRRLTMERADVLYGVTLSEPGLSQVIGVKVDDWA